MAVRAFLLAVCTSILSIAWCAHPSFASHTLVNDPGPEKSHAQILGEVYGDGSAFTQTGAAEDLGNGLWSEFTNGDITAYRIDDWDNGGEGLGTTINIRNGGVGDIDQFFSANPTTVTATVVEAGVANQTFGWNEGNGLDFSKIVAWDEPATDTAVEGYFLWGEEVDLTDVWWSDESANFMDGLADHMVTYKIEGVTGPDYIGKTTWLLFWESDPSAVWDQDYNDLVVELRAAPEPLTIYLLGLGILPVLRRRRNYT